MSASVCAFVCALVGVVGNSETPAFFEHDIAHQHALHQTQCSAFKEFANALLLRTTSPPDTAHSWPDMLAVLWSYPGISAPEVVVYRRLRDGMYKTVAERRSQAQALGASCATPVYVDLVKTAASRLEKLPERRAHRDELREFVLDKAMRDVQQPMHLQGLLQHAMLLMELDTMNLFEQRYKKAAQKMQRLTFEHAGPEIHDPQRDIQNTENFRRDLKRWLAAEIAR